jgi:hypothetical protein
VRDWGGRFSGDEWCGSLAYSVENAADASYCWDPRLGIQPARRVLKMSAIFTPYFEAQADSTDAEAYIRVRIVNEPRPDGFVLVYLPDGTGIVVNSNHLLHFDPSPELSR